MKRIQKLILIVILIVSQTIGVHASAITWDGSAYKVLEDFENSSRIWNAKGARYQSVEVEYSDEQARFGDQSLKMTYDFRGTEGVSGIYAEPDQEILIPGNPQKMGLWVYGDQAGHWMRLQLEDANGHNFNLDLSDESPGVHWRGWRYLEASIPDVWEAPFKISQQGIRYMATNDNRKNISTIYVDQLIAVYEDHKEDFKEPSLNKVYPEEAQVLNDKQFEIKLDVSDEQSGIDPEKTILKLDGKALDFKYHNDLITYRVEGHLSDGLHKLDLELFDQAGNHLLETWTFYLDTDDVQFHLEKDEDAYLSGSKNNRVLLKAQHIDRIDDLTFTLDHSDHLENLRFEANPNHLHRVSKDVHSIVPQSNDALLGTIVFDIPKEAHGQFQINLPSLEYRSGEEVGTYKIKSLIETLVQPLHLEVEGLSQGNQTIMRITDLNKQAVEGVKVEVVKGPEVVKLTKDSYIWQGASGVAEERMRAVSKGEVFAIAKEPYENFPYYRIYLEDGNQRYFYLPKEDVEKIPWDSLWSKSDENGIIDTNFLTLTQIPLVLQASKNDLVSQLLEIELVAALVDKKVDNILLTHGENGSTNFNIMWKGDPKSKIQRLYWKEKGKEDFKQIDVEGKLLADRTGEFRQFKYSFTDLNEDSEYAFYIQDGDFISALNTFKTRSKNSEALKFAFVADSQAYDDEGFSLYQNVIEMVQKKHDNLNFVAHGGDLVEEGNRLNQWDLFLKYQSQTQLPLISTLGNHDVYGNGYNIYNSLIKNPQNGPKDQENTVYYIDIAPARFIVLNTETTVDKMREQVAWMEKVLEDNPMTWSFVLFHRSPYKSNPKRQHDSKLDVFIEALEKLKVDFVLTGHDHSYMRRRPVHEDSGPIYIIGGSSGPKFYPAEVSDYTEVSYGEEKQVIVYFDIDKDSVKLIAYNSNAEVIDEFEFVKKIENQDERPIVTPEPQPEEPGDKPVVTPEPQPEEPGDKPVVTPEPHPEEPGDKPVVTFKPQPVKPENKPNEKELSSLNDSLHGTVLPATGKSRNILISSMTLLALGFALWRNKR